MLKNYLLIAWRNMRRHRVFTFINLFGLAVGLTCCLLIALYIRQELSYDTYHKNADRIYRVTRNFSDPDGNVNLHLANVAPPFGPLLKNDFPDVEQVARTLQTNTLLALDREHSFNESEIFFAEPAFFKIFTVPVRQGSPDKALQEPYSIMLTEKMAKKYFPDKSPMGQVLRMNNQFNVKVTGVYESFPANSHMHPDFLVSFNTLEDSTIYGKQNLLTNWGNNSFNTYLLFPKDYPVANIEAQFPAFIDRHMTEESDGQVKPSSWTKLFLQKLTDIHLRSHLDSEIEPNGNITNVYLFSAVALFILLIACINFMNLSTARSSLRAKEIGLRKVMGATQPNLIRQFLSESLLFALLAVIIALVLTRLTLPILNRFLEEELRFTFGNGGVMILVMVGLALLVGLIAGSYPALFLSSFQPVKVLKGKLTVGRNSVSLRKTLVVLQFAISVVLLVCTAIVYKQLGFCRNMALGFDKEHIVTMDYTSELNDKFNAFRNEVLASGPVMQVGRSIGVPSDRLLNSMGTVRIQKEDSLAPSPISFQYLGIDEQFIDTYKIKLVAGRNFAPREYPTDDSMAFILNEAGVKMLGFTNPREALGRNVEYGNRKGKLVGVLQDFHFESMHEKIKPLIFIMSQGDGYNDLSFKIKGNQLQAGLAHIEKTWKQFLPHRPFEYTFLDEKFGRLYETEQRLGTLFTFFSAIAILIACLGLFGLASFAIEQRTKEIGIRKVLGASTTGIVSLLSKDFLKLVLLANILAWPIAWYGMHQWLQDFAYRTPISWWTFGLATVLAVIIALLTVSFHAIKAAGSNPANALRSE
ncbi:macrolide export ATP-binding/permease MacB [Adhaeribacter arboris]|uniref:Macrolide export ATP-binding/permease MacB n=1 Tax=Adhaeribacter arboris TaxID=2072846 RepID=A0A2T2YII9_9BACT|nr:ABC transporter permease [Adhaeribacter arboris]PSR55333.1 macrolide export ATP-binding/permease MacB [Adhaeribacter arboris]